MNSLKRQGPVIALFAAWIVFAEPAFAQRRRLLGPELPQPSLQSIYPQGLQRGQTVEITVRGTEIHPPTVIWFDDPSLTAEHVKDLTFRVHSTQSTPLGRHDIRVSTPFGVSNARVLVVGDRPESTETEPNNRADQANAIALNSVKNAEIGAPTDVDWFVFDGRKNQRVFIEIEAERNDSQLDATLRLVDAKGRELAESRDAEGADPLIDAVLPADGRYWIKAQDVTYGGSPHHGYRLTLTDAPRIDAIQPALARPGEKRSYTLLGRNLGGEPAGRMVDGHPLERKVVEITAPAFTEEPPTGSLLVRSAEATRKGFEYALDSPSGRSNSVFISWAEDPIVDGNAVQADANHVRVVEPPCVISGAFEQLNDFDVYRFHAKKGEDFWIETSAESIGSSADPVVVIQQVSEKGEASDLQILEDQPDAGARLRFGTNTVDGSGRWTAPADGTFQVRLNDLFGPQRGDVRLAYRLSIRQPRPDFTLVAMPESPNLPDAVAIPRGGRALGYVLALRTDGFDGPIRVSAVDLPPGLRVVPVIIPAGQTFAPIVFEAAADAPLAVSTTRLVGRSRFADRKDSVSHLPGLTKYDADQTHRALGGGVVWPGGNPANPGQGGDAPARLTRGFVVQTAELPSFRVSLDRSRINATRNGLVSVDVNIERTKGFDEAVNVNLIPTVPGLNTTPAITIPKNESKGNYQFMINGGAQVPSLSTLVFQGSGTMPFNPDPKATSKPNVTLSEPSNPIELGVRDSPLKLAINLKGGSIKAGGELEIELTASGSEGSFPIHLVAPAKLKLSSPDAYLTSGQTLKWTIKAAADAPVGPVLGVGVKIDHGQNGEDIGQIEPLGLTIAK